MNNMDECLLVETFMLWVVFYCELFRAHWQIIFFIFDLYSSCYFQPHHYVYMKFDKLFLISFSIKWKFNKHLSTDVINNSLHCYGDHCIEAYLHFNFEI